YISTTTTLDGTFDWKANEAENMQRNLSNLYNLLSEVTRKRKKGKMGPAGKAFTSKFENSLKEVGEALDEMRLRDYGNIVIHAIPSWIKKLKRRANEDEVRVVCDLIAEKYVKMLNPIIPHLSEEMWNKLGNKGLVSMENWPEYDKKLINEKLLAYEELADRTTEDIRNVLKLVKFKPKRIRLFVSPKWKYAFFKKLKKEIEKTRDVKKIMKKVMDKKHGMEISKIVPAVMKDPSKLPSLVMDQDNEFSSLSEAKNFLEKEFNCEIEIQKAEDSKSDKAMKAIPGKPGIEVQ
ncbi:MAG: class I tRNA ligase family protein, partial [Candidatus Aenigmarchaeota archaeon]